MSAVVINRKVTFGRPTIGPRDYVSINVTSGWPECFARKESDHRLADFIGERISVHELLDNFCEFVELKNDGRCGYTDVLRYLGRITETDPEEISYQVVIAFWAQMVIREAAAKNAAKLDKKGSKKCQ